MPLPAARLLLVAPFLTLAACGQTEQAPVDTSFEDSMQQTVPSDPDPAPAPNNTVGSMRDETSGGGMGGPGTPEQLQGAAAPSINKPAASGTPGSGSE